MMATEDKMYCGSDDRSHVDQGNDTQLAMLSKKLGVSVKDILDVMSTQQIGINRVEDYFHNKQNAY
jgi:hypothetical protein